MKKRFRTAVMLAVIVCASIGWTVVRAQSGDRSMRTFDADRLAALELDMWQAYYAKERLRLFRGLVTMLHEQYGYSWAHAVRAGFYLARAAATFGDATTSYERVLPDIERGYAIGKAWTGERYDPADVAKAELA